MLGLGVCPPVRYVSIYLACSLLLISLFDLISYIGIALFTAVSMSFVIYVSLYFCTPFFS